MMTTSTRMNSITGQILRHALPAKLCAFARGLNPPAPLPLQACASARSRKRRLMVKQLKNRRPRWIEKAHYRGVPPKPLVFRRHLPAGRAKP